ncbi:MAG: hypothetical protein M9925_10205 [Chloroflexi bacterium]|nr:hypothetical protein [Chloroflexota bacterium]
MTTRDLLHRLLDRLTDAEIEALARIAREHGLDQPQKNGALAPDHLVDARQYPVLTAIWDNDHDAIFDAM